ncbi:DUF1868 domain-containing protein [Mesorhizobium sp. PAMC28654]|uniref:DUF1868 domain-containing protein n=1 Tax=Mesorhizobium sp. PAMC28654 TaxID=2880934 RepID=UPI0039B5B20E
MQIVALYDADRLAFTPVSSLHMTLFQGIIEHRPAYPTGHTTCRSTPASMR